MDMAIKRGAFTRAFRSDVTLDFARALDGRLDVSLTVTQLHRM